MNLICTPRSWEERNMARAKMARAEIWQLYNISMCTFGGGDGVGGLEAGCVKFRTRIYFLCLLFCFVFAIIINHNDCIANKLSQRKLLESYLFWKLCPGRNSTTLPFSLGRESIVWIGADEVGRDQIMQGIIDCHKEVCPDHKSNRETCEAF